MTNVLEAAGQDSGRPSYSATGEHGKGRHRFRGASYPLAFLLLSLFALAPLAYPGYFQVHSGFLPILNLVDLATSPDKLRWLPGIGAGYDLLRGEGPLAYWLALPLSYVLGDIGAVKAVFALGILLGGLGTLALVRRLVPPHGGGQALAWRAGLLAGIIFLLWPPLLATVYVRGALSEALLMGILPWVLWLAAVTREPQTVRVSSIANEQLATGADDHAADGQKQAPRGKRQGLGYLVAAALVTGLLFFTQAGLALWAMPLLLAWAAWPGTSWSLRLPAVGAALAGAAAGAGLLWLLHAGTGLGGLPAPDFAAHAVRPYQLLSAYWGHGISTPGWQDGLPLQLGLAAVGLAMLSGVLLLSQGRLKRGKNQGEQPPSKPAQEPSSPLRPTGSEVLRDHPAMEPSLDEPQTTWYALAFALAATLILVFLTTTLARPLWFMLPVLARPLTYPWQLNALLAPMLVLLAASVVVLERRLAQLTVWAGLVALVVLSSYSYLAPRFTAVRPDLDRFAIFGEDQVALLTAQVDGPLPADVQAEDAGHETVLQASQVLTVTVNWQALQPLDFDYNVFVHAVDESDAIVAQWDGQPRRDGQAYPMTTWPVGEVLSDAYALALDEESAGRVARVHMGLYDWQTGQRLSVGGDDHVTWEVGGGER